MKILVTGADGFIGQHIVPRIQEKHQVIKFESNLLDFESAYDEVLDSQCDQIVHLAARTEVEKSFYEPTVFSKVNYLGTENIVNAASKLPNLKNFVFASTMEVFGWQPVSDDIKNGFVPDVIPDFDHTTDPNPNAPYAVAKLACEKYLQYAHRCKKLPFTALRQTNTYGRKDNNFFVVEQIISQMLADKNDIYLGYDTPYRNFLYIEDLVELWCAIIDKYDKVNNGQIFTIGPNNAVSIAKLADMISEKLDWRGNIHWHSKPERDGEIWLLNSDCKQLTKCIGWEPKTSLSNGLDKTIKDLKHVSLRDAETVEQC